MEARKWFAKRRSPLASTLSLASAALYAIDATFAARFCSRLECECEQFNLAGRTTQSTSFGLGRQVGRSITRS